jgi:hypothetical protein
MQPWSAEIQAVLLAEIAAAQPDLVLHLGDFTCGGGSFGMADALVTATLGEIVSEFQRLPAAFFGLPGNHDSPLGQPWAVAEALLGLPPGQGSTIDTPQARLVLLNAQGHDQAQIDAALPFDPVAGWVNAAELARLDAALAGAGDRPVLLFSHQLLQPWRENDQPWADLYGIDNRDQVLACLHRHGNVRAVIQAHAHRLDVQQRPIGEHSCWFIILPAVIEYPMAWLELALTSDTLHLTMHRLPLADLAEQSRRAGHGDWRAGQPAWRNLTLPLK